MLWSKVGECSNEAVTHLAAVGQLLGQLHAAVRQVRKHLRVHRLLTRALHCTTQNNRQFTSSHILHNSH